MENPPNGASTASSGTSRSLRPSDHFFDSLKCPVCYDYFSAPVIQWVKGHSICNTWLSNLRTANSWPQCRSVIKHDYRNLVIEEQLEQVTAPWPWEGNGCKEALPLTQRKDHQLLWPYQSHPCWYIQINHCKFRGTPSSLFEHLQTTHGAQHIETGDVLKFNWVLPDREEESFFFVCLTVQEHPYVLEHYYDPISDKVAFLIRSCTTGRSDVFTIAIVESQSDDNRLSFRAPTSSFTSYGLISEFATHSKRKCFVVDYEVLKDYSYAI